MIDNEFIPLMKEYIANLKHAEAVAVNGCVPVKTISHLVDLSYRMNIPAPTDRFESVHMYMILKCQQLGYSYVGLLKLKYEWINGDNETQVISVDFLKFEKEEGFYND